MSQEEASESVIRSEDGSLVTVSPYEIQAPRSTSESDSGLGSERGTPEEEAGAPSEAGSERSSISSLSQDDEESALEEIGWLWMGQLDVWEADMLSRDFGRASEKQTGAAETAALLQDEGNSGQQGQLTNAGLSESKLEMLPVGTSIDVGACVVLASLAFYPRWTVEEWFGPYMNILRHALPLSRGYIVIPQLERMCAQGVPHPYLEVRRMVSLRPVKLHSVLIVFGRNKPADTALFSNFSDIVKGSCSTLSRRILQRNDQAEIFWMGFFGFWWNFGIQREGQGIELLSSPPQAWIDIDDGVSFYRLQQLASEIDKAFPLCTDKEVDGTGSMSNPVAVLTNHFAQIEDSRATRTLWNGLWIELLSRVFPGRKGYVVQSELVDAYSDEDPPLLKVVKASWDSKGKTTLRTVLLFIGRGKHGVLPSTCDDTALESEAKVTGNIEKVLQYRMPQRIPYGPITIPVYWIYGAGAEWIGGVVSPQSSEDEDEDALDVKVLTKWNKIANCRQSRRNLRQLAELARAL